MEVANSSSLGVKIIDIADDNDDILVIYETPKASKGKRKKFIKPISVENYFCSKPSCSGTKKVMIDISDDEIEFLGTKFVQKSKGVSNIKSIVIDDDDDVNELVDKLFTCDICVDEKCVNEVFKIMGCSHSYCKECMAKYIGMKLQENICRISCPVSGCNGQLEPYNCRSILPKEVFDRWGDVLCEALIMGSERFYCPFKDCSALLLIDENGKNSVVIQSECPECRRLFCAKCKVAWHSGIVCEEFQKLNKDEREKEDLQLMQLAKGQAWQRCPRCRIYVARAAGCAQMVCRCGCGFCYKCGAESTNHHCKRCGILNGL
ncbi:probable E3 ubiquitin-protein ligase RNF217 isoform X1 [Solanum tuberosum]|uniref:probable E3 ubiquitin-protein ligase RNF217 isoform X1 n=1 Tax=Solanum tuberosum TaxID=4113 RepID=UPI0003D27AAB|nr:PREDICTED: probable E3 ubiquitin-protein ligase RNF217 isoform X1 [Solanum tuberosum]